MLPKLSLSIWSLVCFTLASLPTPPDTNGTCVGTVTVSGGSSSLDCAVTCSQVCYNVLVNTPLGQGAVCACTSSGWDGCCTVALVPPSTTGIPVAIGDCSGVIGCDFGVCELKTRITGGIIASKGRCLPPH